MIKWKYWVLEGWKLLVQDSLWENEGYGEKQAPMAEKGASVRTKSETQAHQDFPFPNREA